MTGIYDEIYVDSDEYTVRCFFKNWNEENTELRTFKVVTYINVRKVIALAIDAEEKYEGNWD